MFGIIGNYKDRKVARWPDNENWTVDTCMVTDSDKPYETAVKHPEYNNNDMIIVELYGTKEQAEQGHDHWVEVMSADELPERLVDVSTNFVAELQSIFDEDVWRQNPKM